MCLAYPGKVIKIKTGNAIVDYVTEQRIAKLLADDICIGDYVIVQAGVVVQKVPEKEALDAIAVYSSDIA
jgi:hydrogenase assembly chaperone HypC/HupF